MTEEAENRGETFSQRPSIATQEDPGPDGCISRPASFVLREKGEKAGKPGSRLHFARIVT